LSRYEFSFVVTDVELSEEDRERVGRAVALAGAAELGSALPANAVAAPVANHGFLVRHWIGTPQLIELPQDVVGPGRE
jgi:hypothetical protein